MATILLPKTPFVDAKGRVAHEWFIFLTQLLDGSLGGNVTAAADLTEFATLYGAGGAAIAAAADLGTAGQVWTSNGPGVPPTFESGVGTGTVTSVDVTPGAGIASSGGPITGAGAITVGLAPIADQRVFANISGGSAAPSANTLSAILDAILGSTQGQIITRNGATWTVLNPGAAGTVLTSGGAGANVSYTTPSAGGGVTEGRLQQALELFNFV